MLKRIPIRLKLVLLAGVPVIGALILAATIAREASQQAESAAAIGSIEDLARLSGQMARLVHEHSFGVVAGSFDAADLAARIRELEPADILRMKERADAASRVLNAEQARAVFLAEVERITA